MSRLHNKTYVIAYHPSAYISRYSRHGKRTKQWHVYIPGMPDMAGTCTWRFAARSATVAWRLAAEAVEGRVRRGERRNYR